MNKMGTPGCNLQVLTISNRSDVSIFNKATSKRVKIVDIGFKDILGIKNTVAEWPLCYDKLNRDSIEASKRDATIKDFEIIQDILIDRNYIPQIIENSNIQEYTQEIKFSFKWEVKDEYQQFWIECTCGINDDLSAGIRTQPGITKQTEYRFSQFENIYALEEWPQCYNFRMNLGYTTFAIGSYYGDATSKDFAQVVRIMAKYDYICTVRNAIDSSSSNERIVQYSTGRDAKYTDFDKYTFKFPKHLVGIKWWY